MNERLQHHGTKPASRPNSHGKLETSLIDAWDDDKLIAKIAELRAAGLGVAAGALQHALNRRAQIAARKDR